MSYLSKYTFKFFQSLAISLTGWTEFRIFRFPFLLFHPRLSLSLCRSCFHLHMRDIRRVLIMLPDRWPLSSSFHKIAARGGTTYYVPGTPSHTVFHSDRPHWDRLNVVALKRGDSGVNFSVCIKRALKLYGANSVTPWSALIAFWWVTNWKIFNTCSNSPIVHIFAVRFLF